MKKLLLVLTLALLVSGSASAAVVYLNDGSTVRGTVVSATARDIRVHTDKGTVTINADRIARIEYSESDKIMDDLARWRLERSINGPKSDQPYDLRQLFSVDVGFSNPISRLSFDTPDGGSSDNGDSGFLLGAQYVYYLTRRLGLGMNLEYAHRSRTASQSLEANGTADVYGGTLLVMPIVRFSLATRGPVRPYLLAGVGSNRTSTTIDLTPNAGFGWLDTGTNERRTLVDESRWGLATTARFGLDFMAADPGIFSLEFGWTGISNSDYTATAAGKSGGLERVTGDLTLLTIGARWGLRF